MGEEQDPIEDQEQSINDDDKDEFFKAVRKGRRGACHFKETRNDMVLNQMSLVSDHFARRDTLAWSKVAPPTDW